MKRTYLLIVLMLLAGMLLPACQVPSGGEEAAPADETGAEDSSVELHIFHFKVNLQTEWQALTDEYSEMNPNVTFINEIIGGGSQWMPILKSKFAAGHGPDIFIAEHIRLRGALCPRWAEDRRQDYGDAGQFGGVWLHLQQGDLRGGRRH